MSSPAERPRPLVLHVRCVTGTGGGPEKTILNSPRFLDQLGYRSICAYMHPPADGSFELLVERAAKAQAPLVSVPDRGPLDWRVVKQLVRLCRAERVTIWHGHDYKSNTLGLVVRRFWPMKLVTTVHGWSPLTPRTRLYYRIDKLCLRHYDQVVCVSDDLYRECLRVGVPEACCHLIHNAIDTEEYRRRKPIREAKTGFDLPPRGLLIGAAGRLSEEKGFDLLIRAVAQLAGQGHDLSLWIAGEGHARPQLTRLIDELACGNCVRLLGHVNDLKPIYEAMDLYVLSSLREGLPNVILEAMAMEVPVVATRVAGVPSVIRGGENGLLVDAGSVPSLAAAIESLVSDPARREKLAAAGRTTIEQSYSFLLRMQKMARVYDAVLGRNAK